VPQRVVIGKTHPLYPQLLQVVPMERRPGVFTEISNPIAVPTMSYGSVMKASGRNYGPDARPRFTSDPRTRNASFLFDKCSPEEDLYIKFLEERGLDVVEHIENLPFIVFTKCRLQQEHSPYHKKTRMAGMKERMRALKERRPDLSRSLRELACDRQYYPYAVICELNSDAKKHVHSTAKRARGYEQPIRGPEVKLRNLNQGTPAMNSGFAENFSLFTQNVPSSSSSSSNASGFGITVSHTRTSCDNENTRSELLQMFESAENEPTDIGINFISTNSDSNSNFPHWQ
jgi:hypothetical protein